MLLAPLPIDGVYIRRCRQGAIQFVLLKPILAGLTLMLTWGGVYGDNEIVADRAYLYIAFVYNMSYTPRCTRSYSSTLARTTCSNRTSR